MLRSFYNFCGKGNFASIITKFYLKGIITLVPPSLFFVKRVCSTSWLQVNVIACDPWIDNWGVCVWGGGGGLVVNVLFRILH